MEQIGITKTSDGRIRIRASVVNPKTGKTMYRRATLPSGTTLREARHVRDQLKLEMLNDEPKIERNRTTLADYAELWIVGMAARCKPSTVGRYHNALAHHILPIMGEYLVSAITRRDVDAWARLKESETFNHHGEVRPYSTASVRGWWRVLLQLLRDAHAEGLMLVDPTLRVPAPDTGVRQRREQQTLTVEELGALLEAIPSNRYAEVVTLAWTGMRPGELYSLTWSDVDLRGGRITVGTAVWRGHVGTTKTDAAREVPIGPELVAILDQHRREQIINQVPGLELGLLFPSDAGTHRTAGSLRKTLDTAASVAEIDQRVTPQVLRRTWNTLLTAAGVDRIVVRSMLGHSSEQMTERYSGIRLERKQEAVSLVLRPTKK